MNMYYEETLYPLQDKVLALIDSAATPFYLTGGTALSRFYYRHRYSEDLDFFVNTYERFTQDAERILLLFKDIDLTVTSRTDTHFSLFVQNVLKIDFVNDTGRYPSKLRRVAEFSKVDTPERILANKLSALVGRDDPKDVVDLWVVATHETIDWRSIFTDISSRAAGVFPPFIAEKISSFPLELLDVIKWKEGKRPQPEQIKNDLIAIADVITHA